MQPRFVVVPAVPLENHYHRRGVRFYSGAAFAGFDLYDNVEKLRLTPTFNQRAEAECLRRNQSYCG